MAAVAAVFVALTAGTIVSTWQAQRARVAKRAAVEAESRARTERDDAVRERNRALTAEEAAQQERNRAVSAQELAQAERSRAIEASHRATTEAAISRAVRDFLQSDLLAQSSAQQQATPDSKPDPDLKVRTALDRAAARVPARFRDQPLVEASVRQTIGTAYQDLGFLRAGAGTIRARAAAAEERGRRAARIDARLTQKPGAEHDAARQVSGGRDALPAGDRRSPRRRGRSDAAVLEAQAELVEVYLQQGRYKPAEALILKTVETQRRVLGADHPSTLASQVRAGARRDLAGQVHGCRGDPANAVLGAAAGQGTGPPRHAVGRDTTSATRSSAR